MEWSVGGSKDINAFRECIDKRLSPQASSLTYQGIFYDYYFKNIHPNNLFYPSHCYAKCKDEHYISVLDEALSI